jgi:hypothetical protein
MSHLAEEFRRFAENAGRMARTTLSADDRDYWSTLAERWLRCAENAERPAAATKKRKTYRKLDPIKKKAA